MTDETPTPHTKSIDLKSGLRAWAEKNHITPTKFSDATGYRYAHAQGLLNGERPVTFEMLGRFIETYGPKACGELLSLAGLPVTLTDEVGTTKPATGKPVLVMYQAADTDPATQTA